MPLIITNKKLSFFWMYQIIFWSFWYVVNIIMGTGFFSKKNTEIIIIVKYWLFLGIAGFILSSVLYIFYSHLLGRRKISLKIVPLFSIPLSYICGLIWGLTSHLSDALLTSSHFQFELKRYFFFSFDNTFQFLAWSFLFFLFEYLKELQVQRENAIRATALAHQAQLQMLRYQLNPHFLFNTLNSIRAMVEENKKKARQMITELSEFLRFSLLNGSKEEVTVGDEIEAIRNYLNIQKIRYEDKFETTINISPDVLKIKIPCFIIHPLVENAVKYGTLTSPVLLKLSISVRNVDNGLDILVSNTGKLVVQEENDQIIQSSTQVGLENIRKRLNYIYNEAGSFKIYEENNWVYANIYIKNIISRNGKV